MNKLEYLFGGNEVKLLDKIALLLFGEDVACEHGTRGSDGVCMDCCNDMFSSDLDELDQTAEIIDFPANRDTV